LAQVPEGTVVQKHHPYDPTRLIVFSFGQHESCNNLWQHYVDFLAHLINVKVKFTLEQGMKAQSDRWGWVIIATPWLLYLWQRPDTHCIGGWVGPRAGLDVCGNPHLHWDMILESPAQSKSLY